MRFRVLLLAVLSFVVVGSAAPASFSSRSKPNLVRVVKHTGAFTATLTYTRPLRADGHVSLVVRRHNHVVLRHQVPNPGAFTPSLRFQRVAGRQMPAAVVDSYESSLIALLSPHPIAVTHYWGRSDYRGSWLGGHYYFVSGDNRFWCVYASCAATWVPARIWAVRSERLINATGTVPHLVELDARAAWRWYLRHGRPSKNDRGIGILAGWCADEFVLGRGTHCERVLRQKLAAGLLKAPGALSGRRFIRTLNSDLQRWGYMRR